MKIVGKQLWHEPQEDGNVRIGFTPEFIEQLQDCFHIIPSKQKSEIRENAPLFAVETGMGLFSVSSPVQGVVTFFDNKIVNSPDKINTEDTVIILGKKKEINKYPSFQASPTLNQRAWHLRDQGEYQNIAEHDFVSIFGTRPQEEVPMPVVESREER